jgi:hypothetical protein
MKLVIYFFDPIQIGRCCNSEHVVMVLSGCGFGGVLRIAGVNYVKVMEQNLVMRLYCLDRSLVPVTGVLVLVKDLE